jgi:hypothetical protein
MRHIRTTYFAGLAILLAIPAIAQPLSQARAEDQIVAAANSARPLKKDNLETLFANRTWHWPDGAGYFAAPPDRKFTAWVNSGAKASYAEGSWSATDEGRLCFVAIWHAITGSKKARTCFDHRSDDNAIYQRKLPTGSWYVFSHVPKQPEDEVQKLESGDQVSSAYHKNERFVADNSRHRRARP